jgi:hypothetical protein
METEFHEFVEDGLHMLCEAVSYRSADQQSLIANASSGRSAKITAIRRFRFVSAAMEAVHSSAGREK